MCSHLQRVECFPLGSIEKLSHPTKKTRFERLVFLSFISNRHEKSYH